MMIHKVLITVAALASCGVPALTGPLQTNKIAVFTEAQATVGKAEYLNTCAACHTASLIPADGAKYQGRDIPPLAGARFMAKWGGLTTRDLTARVKIAAGEETHLTITAYILQFNGAPAGEQPLTPDTAIEIRSIAN
jgi:hypothetical protein